MIFKCVLCGIFSFSPVCEKCQRDFLKPSIEYKDEIVSFYRFDDIKELLHYKYEKFGSRIFWIMAKNSLKIFARNYFEKAFLIPVDDNPEKGYSHTAILAKSMQTKYLKPLFSSLRVSNSFKYASKSLKERLSNPRNFVYKGAGDIDVILIDDVTTTSLTLKEAKQTLKKHNVNVLFSVVLARG